VEDKMELTSKEHALEVRGSLKILKLSKATEPWPEILRTIPTEFHGEYFKYNIKR
jgi:hypothetical protein